MFSGHAEFNLPVYILGVSYGGQPSYEVTLYENICTHFCSILACLSAEHYNILVSICVSILNSHIYLLMCTSGGSTFQKFI